MTGVELIAFYAACVVGVGGALTLLYKMGRSLGARFRSAWRKFSGMADALLGRDEIRHPDTGEVLVEATPNIGVRLASIDSALVQLADTSVAVVLLHSRMDAVERRLDQHITDCSTTAVQVYTESATFKESASE